MVQEEDAQDGQRYTCVVVNRFLRRTELGSLHIIRPMSGGCSFIKHVFNRVLQAGCPPGGNGEKYHRLLSQGGFPDIYFFQNMGCA